MILIYSTNSTFEKIKEKEYNFHISLDKNTYVYGWIIRFAKANNHFWGVLQRRGIDNKPLQK